ncbi:helix-turn-helix transcriptional regulator [Paenibacillus sp. MWE-103]|uniref:Helix-turn-helix transcriptional regulator n=1 Tax=Paenibacillus artemisiicola TaxID=1172618 RepID=A0ABS3WD78_9BACL|nr:AraC family transcriptional regulator [Paenibacillus artemisiicola]MBO7746274.1 helix-turn-helix transcriptional regulator [Paenibacillus artemisiicola]
MTASYEALAQAFARSPLDVHGVYRTTLEPELVYDGHLNRPTEKCALIVGLRGQADFTFDGRETHRLEPGRALLGGLGKRLFIRTGPEGFEYGLVHYMPADPAHGRAPLLTEVSLLHAAPDPELRLLLQGLIEADSSPDSMMLLEKKTLFYRLLNKALQAERHERNRRSYPMLDDAIRYVHAHYAEPVTLELLASRYGLKPKYFSSLFRDYVGVGPIDYVIRYRINRAHELLLTGQFTVAAVARSVGYPDAYYFSRLFKKYKGVPPGQAGPRPSGNRPS